MKILNLYAGAGGNRALWPEHHEVTAVEHDPVIAKVYADLHPADTVVVGDAHQYLLNHYEHFDFIWSSPPCQTHSRIRHRLGVKVRGSTREYPDFRLYEEIFLLQRERGDRPWLVENVMPYYQPLIKPSARDARHLYWSNFRISKVLVLNETLRSATIPELQALHGINLDRYRIPNKRQVLRNMVPPRFGLSVLQDVENTIEEKS